MRFPLPLTAKIAKYIISKKLRGVEKFATVLQLEPLHTCNLTCTGCGRIREYSTSLKDVMRLEDCLGAAVECGAPMVSICGGEPLIYPQVEALVNGLLDQSTDRLRLHQWDVHAKEDEGVPGGQTRAKPWLERR